ncbi:MAG: radical SAM family heme chaperone HemW [Pseudomonadota bacterium]
MDDWRAGGFGVYVHWPYCLAKCPYCDFNSHVTRSVDHSAWRSALIQDIRSAAAKVPNRTVDTVFFGGGTPSLMHPETVARVIEEIGTVWTLAPDAEITLEANPTSVETDRFRAFAAAGVNRISMGIQALNDPDLRRLGRTHSVAEARAAFDIARAAFDRVSFDLIYARQGQTREAWRAELGEALTMAIDHLSLYQLTIEPGTRFGELADLGKLRDMPEDETASDMYLETQEICASAGLPAYEVSNHARPGAESRHNLIYWRYGDYAGIGPGAHGRLTRDGTRRATVGARHPDAWLERVNKTGHGLVEETEIPDADQATEMLLMGLRLRDGVDTTRFANLNGKPLDPATLNDLIADGLLEHTRNALRATSAGRPVLNAILRALLV